MANRIKLENIFSGDFDRQTGQANIKLTAEHICEVCRHLVELTDQFCFFCGDQLMASAHTEHWNHGKKLDEAQFTTAKGLQGKAFEDMMDAIPDPLRKKNGT